MISGLLESITLERGDVDHDMIYHSSSEMLGVYDG